MHSHDWIEAMDFGDESLRSEVPFSVSHQGLMLSISLIPGAMNLCPLVKVVSAT